MKKTLKGIVNTAKSMGYTIDNRPFALNIIGIRNSEATSQKKFDDLIAFFYYNNQGNLVGKVCPATTDPSTFWLNQPMNISGAAILKSGEYNDTWSIGMHKGKYEALVQNLKPVTTIRDNDRNAYINYLAPTTTGMYGINIHRATLGKGDITIIDQDSAGCQVFQNKSDFDEMMNLAKNSSQKYGNKFSYILIDERELLKLKNTVGIGIIFLAGAYYLYLKMKRAG